MSRYTVTYGTVYESEFAPLLDVLAGYPIFDESHRAELNQKIYDRYRFREIGFETAAVFAHYFGALLREIMPYYNKLYETVSRDYDYLTDADYSESETVETESASEGSGTAETTETANTTGETHDTNAHSDTPQGAFNFADVENNQYLSDANVNDGTTSTETTTDGTTSTASTMSGTGSSEREKHVSGKFPGRTFAELVREYREQILNVDRLILDELNVCFMGVY